MSANSLKQEMKHLMEIFKRESEISLRKIKQDFVALGRPFDEEFRHDYLNMSILRLDSSFNTILLEQWHENRALQMAPNRSAVIDRFGIGNHMNILRSVRTVTVENHFEFSNVSKNIPMFEMNGPIEVADSDDEPAAEEQQMLPPIGAIGDQLGSTSALDMNSGNECVDGEHGSPIMDIENDIPMLGFDPIDDINPSESVHGVAVAAPFDGHQNQQSSMMKMRPRRNAAKRPVCSCCGPAGDHQKKSKQIPAQLPLQDNVKATVDQKISDKLFKCTHCDLKFTKFAYLSTHRTKFHMNGKNNQRWFNCTRCMRRFANEIDKNWHEAGCENRRYECYLCKVYVTTAKIRMQNHVRTHSGAKPFPCPVCGTYFRSKTYLVRHIGFHVRKNV